MHSQMHGLQSCQQATMAFNKGVTILTVELLCTCHNRLSKFLAFNS